MGYKSRQKKRAAKNRAINSARSQHADKIAGRWYLTIVERKTCCALCGGILNVGGEMVYRHRPLESRCKPCAEDDPDCRPRTSTRWEKRQPKRKPDRRAY